MTHNKSLLSVLLFAVFGVITLTAITEVCVWYLAHWLPLPWFVIIVGGGTLGWIVLHSIYKERRMLSKIRDSRANPDLIDFHRKQQGSAAPYIPETAESLDAKWRGIDHEDRGR